MSNLNGKRAFVTGAGNGIGRAVARRLAADGASVGLFDVDRGGIEKTLADIELSGGTAIGIPGDVSIEAEVEAAVHRASRTFGGLTTVVGVAGIELWKDGDTQVHELSLELWERTMATNLTGMFLTCKHGIRALLDEEGGSLIIVGSPTGLYGCARGETAYSASKSGVHGLARVVSSDYAGSGVRTNIVVPGFIDTVVNQPVTDDPQMLNDAMAGVPMGRMGRPDEVAAMVGWLASDDASYSTGGYFFVDGGQTSI